MTLRFRSKEILPSCQVKDPELVLEAVRQDRRLSCHHMTSMCYWKAPEVEQHGLALWPSMVYFSMCTPSRLYLVR